MQQIDLILFDLGGVLIEHGGVSRMIEWTGGTRTVEELWHEWIVSPAVMEFESGKSSPEDFAAKVIAEFALPVGAEEFLEEFKYWLKRVYPGTISLLEKLSASYKLASLSNSNAIHWERVCRELGLAELFDFNFPSHETGLAKPDKEAFLNAARTAACPPERVLFFDDNRINVESARSVGMVSHKVSGLRGTQYVLTRNGFLSTPPGKGRG